ncbi:hypothetical protein Taro_052271 [Colocasia esculenta]|uniref:Uncharacterized protein n=1 Tax=Colocasia esculenta TaxID=4460 RepID=A0A843XJD0_COLES|nr:hypothetical protein [Colocasia esculenta]
MPRPPPPRSSPMLQAPHEPPATPPSSTAREGRKKTSLLEEEEGKEKGKKGKGETVQGFLASGLQNAMGRGIMLWLCEVAVVFLLGPVLPPPPPVDYGVFMQGLVQAMQTQAHTQAALQAQLEAQVQAPVPQSQDHGGPSIMEKFKRMAPPSFKGESDSLLAES